MAFLNNKTPFLQAPEELPLLFGIRKTACFSSRAISQYKSEKISLRVSIIDIKKMKCFAMLCYANLDSELM